MACCPPGSAPYLAADHVDEGVGVYHVGSGAAGLLIIPDVWGWNSGRTRAFADDFARKGLSVWVPKMLTAFEGGTDGDGLPPSFNPAERGAELGALFAGAWGPEAVMPKVLQVVGMMRASGVTKFGVLGFCYGGWIGFHLSKIISSDVMVCGAVPHPSVHIESRIGKDALKLTEEVQCPWILFPCGELGGAGADPDMYDAPEGPSIKQILEEKFPGQSVVQRLPGAFHGFTTRAPASAGPEMMALIQKTMDDAYAFFQARGLVSA